MTTPTKAQLRAQLQTLRSTGFADKLPQDGNTHALPVAYIYAIASRETNCRNILGDFVNGEAHGVGIMQIDIQHPIAGQARDSGSWQTNPDPLIEFGAQMLRTNIDRAAQRSNHPGCSRRFRGSDVRRACVFLLDLLFSSSQETPRGSQMAIIRNCCVPDRYHRIDHRVGLQRHARRSAGAHLYEARVLWRACGATGIRHLVVEQPRKPAGVTGRRFVHFHYEQPLPEFVETVDIFSEKAGRAEQYLLCNNAATLIWLAHVGSLEFHAWHSRTTAGPDAKDARLDFQRSRHALEQSVLNFPDYIVCDLDPYIYSGEEAAGGQPAFNAGAFARCKEVAFSLKERLDSMHLQSFVKTSGKTGLHILVPIKRRVTYDAARALAHELGKHLVAQHPELVTTDQRVSQRTGKIFFDYGMNARVKTLITPYSVRGVVGAPVSMPIEWDDLEHASPIDYTMANVPQIVDRRGDIWADMLSRKQDVQSILSA